MKAITIVLGSALITAAALKAAPAVSQPAGDTGEVAISHVRTADLDLSTDAGRHKLDLRLAHAAREVCGDASNLDLEGKNKVRACRDQVLARAHAQRDALLASAARDGTITVAAAR
jgi:UrcA family protein